MQEQLKAYINQQNLFPQTAKLLLAVSGGIDSVVLCHLLKELKLSFGIAHCNFQLRGEDSNQDALFVEQLALQLEVPFHITSFETKKLLENSKESTQSLARKLRYDWFEEIVLENGYEFILTAHHKNDLAETIVYNLAKGTGIRGIRGILPKRKKIIRPLLCFTKAEILAFAKANQIAYREDISNQSVDYQRNYIRHELIPLFEKINPKFIESIAESSTYFRDIEHVLNDSIKQFKKKNVEQLNGYISMDIAPILKKKAFSSLLFELFSKYGFNKSQVQQIEQSYPSQGKQFFSKTHQLVIHQKKILLRKIQEAQKVYQLEVPARLSLSPPDCPYYLDLSLAFLEAPLHLRLDSYNENHSRVVFLDADKMSFPLTLRTWKKGDYFQPLGMKGKRQKIQDFYSNNKLSLFEKDTTFLVESDGKICWVVGYRIDERFKVTDKTKNVLRLNLEIYPNLSKKYI